MTTREWYDKTPFDTKAKYAGLETLQKLRAILSEDVEAERGELIRTSLDKAEAAMIKAGQEKPNKPPTKVPHTDQRRQREDDSSYNMPATWRSNKPKDQEPGGEIHRILYDLGHFLSKLHRTLGDIDHPLKIYLLTAKDTRDNERDEQTPNRRLGVIKEDYVLAAETQFRWYYEDLGRDWTIEQSASDYSDKLEYTHGKDLDPSGFQIYRKALEVQASRGRMAKCFLEHLNEMFVDLENLELRLSERER
jgi:hypothetical protein